MSTVQPPKQVWILSIVRDWSQRLFEVLAVFDNRDDAFRAGVTLQPQAVFFYSLEMNKIPSPVESLPDRAEFIGQDPRLGPRQHAVGTPYGNRGVGASNVINVQGGFRRF